MLRAVDRLTIRVPATAARSAQVARWGSATKGKAARATATDACRRGGGIGVKLKVRSDGGSRHPSRMVSLRTDEGVTHLL